MTLPVPVPLDPPPEDPVALAELVSAVTGAAFRTGVLAAHLAGPAATAPGWLSRDAAAAAEQVGRVAALLGALHDGLTAAEVRLRVHAGVLDHARSRIAVLQRQQDDDFAAASARRAPLPDPSVADAAPDELAGAESARRHEHAALLERVEADATATAGVLTGGTTALGGTGSPGQESRVRAALADLLPGWGDGEMVARGWSAARALDGPVPADEIDAIARDGLAYARNPAYAGALLANLGVDGVRWLLTGLGQDAVPPEHLAGWLAAAVGAAAPAGPGPLQDVLDARYVDPDDRDGTPDAVVLGLAAVVVAAPAAAGGVPDRTAAAWCVQMLERERRQGLAAGARLTPAGPDPVEEVLDRLAATGDPDAAAVLLGGRESWDALLARSWDDGGAAVGTLCQAAGGDTAVRSGLMAMGHGLSPRSGESWTVDRTTAAQLAPALATAVGEHVGVATVLLGAAGAGAVLTLPEEEMLRGLAYLSLDPRSGAAVQEAVDGWAALHLGDGHAAEVTGAWVAAREYAQRLQHALAGYDAMSDAVDRQLFYDMTLRFPAWAVGQVVEHRPGGGFVAGLIGVGVDAGAHLANADGSWVNPPDRGLVLDREDAAAAVARLVPATDPTGAEQLARQARAAFDRTARALGVPAPPEPDTDPAHLFSDEPAEQGKAFVDGAHRVPE